MSKPFELTLIDSSHSILSILDDLSGYIGVDINEEVDLVLVGRVQGGSQAVVGVLKRSLDSVGECHQGA